MKIIAGKYRGLKVDVINENIRPTKAVVREAIFNILVHCYYNHLNNGVFLDLFCGTGILGLEALSRGAKQVVMVDKDVSNALWNVKKISDKIDVDDVKILKTDALKIPTNDAECNVIILDPPYCNTGIVNKVFDRLLNKAWIFSGTIIIIEMPANSSLSNVDYRFNVIDSRNYGLSKIMFFVYNGK